MAYLYVFVDEGGNYDFSKKGTAYWVLTCLLATDINPGVMELYVLKHRLIDLGTDLECFHASEDRQAVRNEVFGILAKADHIRIDSVVVGKRKTAPSIRPLNQFYPMMVEKLLQYPFDPRGLDITAFDKVLIFADRATATKREQKILKKALKAHLKPHLRGVPYEICMHASMSHPYLQLVDYANWAIYVKWERNETRPYDCIKHLVKSEFPIFAQGTINWY
ncbi:MAG TPA: DUF3800 domain-containing protein [Anaerolineae bacterium]|nr:DUF3800 domain-containing protein [Anaerolineae bacterium]